MLVILQHCNTIHLEKLGAALKRGAGGSRLFTAFVTKLVQCLSCDDDDDSTIIALAQAILLARKSSVPMRRCQLQCP